MGSEMIVIKPKSATRGVPVSSINMFALIGIKVIKMEEWLRQTETYALEIPMDHSLVVNVNQPPSNTFQLEVFVAVNGARTEKSQREGPTSVIRFTSGRALTKSPIFPFTIQSDIIANWFLDIATPMSDRTFGCRSDFHSTTSLQNVCTRGCQRTGTQNKR